MWEPAWGKRRVRSPLGGNDGVHAPFSALHGRRRGINIVAVRCTGRAAVRVRDSGRVGVHRIVRPVSLRVVQEGWGVDEGGIPERGQELAVL